jgi:hypothetical protein
LEYTASIFSAVIASLTLRVMLAARPISSGYRLRASCCVIVEPPCRSPLQGIEQCADGAAKVDAVVLEEAAVLDRDQCVDRRWTRSCPAAPTPG